MAQGHRRPRLPRHPRRPAALSISARRRPPGVEDSPGFLTKRDRYANNIGASLRFGDPEPEVDFPTPVEIAAITARCDEAQRANEVGPDEQKHESFEPSDLLDEVVRQRYSPPSFTPWLEHTDVRDLPIVPDDRPR